MTTATLAAPAGAGLRALPEALHAADGWAELRAALAANRSGTVDGAWGSSASLAASALAADVPGTLLVVVPNPTDVSPWVEDIASFTGIRPAVFEAWETWPVVSNKGKLDPTTTARLRLLQQLQLTPPKALVCCIAAVCQPVPERADLAARGRTVTTAEIVEPSELAEWLVANGYKRVDAVEYPGEFSRRGGICDVFPPDAPDPVRFEFFGDEVESIRTFAAGSQRSLESKTSVVLMGMAGEEPTPNPSLKGGGRGVGSSRRAGSLTDYLPADSWVALAEPRELKDQAKHFLERVATADGLFTPEAAFASLMKLPNVVISALPRPSVEASVHLRVESVERFSGSVHRVRDELDLVASGTSAQVLIACQSEAEVHRLTEVLKAGKLAESHRLQLVTGHVRAGFRLVTGGRGGHPSEGIVVLGSHEIFHKDLLPPGVKVQTRSSRQIESRAIDTFLDLNDGDYVVHVAHGIARFRGMKMLEKTRGPEPGAGSEDAAPESPGGSAFEENLILEFRDGVFLYVPATRIDLVQKYVGGSQTEPELSKLGGTAWARKKDRVSEAVRDMAADMIQIQAVRQAVPGFPFPADSEWQKEFEAAFPYQETPDQLSAISEVKGDLEKAKPMDRLICGDVGYGKTEVAIRAAFKAVDSGKQVAILVPTTVLAEQHYRTFSQRFAEYPFVVDVVNRFKGGAKQKETLKKVASGEIDVIVGTHRLLSKDVKFKDLGLVVIDEEQRFGVEHKERLKMLRAMVDVLTMTATPIPRTLHASLLGIREISNLETPPADRQPVETRIHRWDDQLIRGAILREMNRGGQVYFVHNRVQDIYDIATKIKILVPEAKVTVGHGQMDAHDLEKAMVAFVRKDADILVATTIIESGLDIPNANTIFIDEADMYGLADLHQLRGRVGRSKNRAYAYLIVNPLKLLNPTAQRRLKAIEEFTELGAGFKIAMRDLEIRGAGNILGAEQSGHIAAIGYELYCQLLENAVRALKQQPPKVPVEVNVDLPWPSYLPRDYVPGQKLRIEVYRRLARLRDPAKLADFRQELRDRYGPYPEPVEWLLRTTEIRLLCVKWQVSSVHRDNRDLIFNYRSRERAQQLVAASKGRMKIVDDKSIYMRLRPDDKDDAEGLYKLLVGTLKTNAV
ncbi:transcription-repair coupling factor [Frigoriglobus tundricola]|uniref:Transcription-repair-coupling factor n=1 Tax=Frigoriglobus tundricola TaxID=2774151 RepID=A0A6M5YS74_9BACT|nr:transcription-repair coupling factor [Frigoriglobus tundricola]QJW95832.1 Transcription-repair coupling factor [Frigoriglobus tundricola]